MLGTSEETGLLELPSGRCLQARLLCTQVMAKYQWLGKPIREMTEEMLLKKSEKNRKRRLQALKRKEKDKVCV